MAGELQILGVRERARSAPGHGTCVSAGEYIIYFEAQGFTWRLQQVVKVPLQTTEVVLFPDQLSISCDASPGFQLSCCFPSTNLDYTAAWSPREDSQGRRGMTLGSEQEEGSWVSRAAKWTLPKKLGVGGPRPALSSPHQSSRNSVDVTQTHTTLQYAPIHRISFNCCDDLCLL